METTPPSKSRHYNETTRVLSPAPDYGTSRAIARIIEALGWLIFIVGGIAASAGIAGGFESIVGKTDYLLATLPGIGITISGLLVIAAGMTTKVSADSAEYMREILELLQADRQLPFK